MSGNPNFNIFIKELKEKRKKERLANIRGQNSLLFLKKKKINRNIRLFRRRSLASDWTWKTTWFYKDKHSEKKASFLSPDVKSRDTFRDQRSIWSNMSEFRSSEYWSISDWYARCAFIFSFFFLFFYRERKVLTCKGLFSITVTLREKLIWLL